MMEDETQQSQSQQHTTTTRETSRTLTDDGGGGDSSSSDTNTSTMSVRAPPNHVHHQAPQHQPVQPYSSAEAYRAAEHHPLLPPIQHFDGQQTIALQPQYAPPPPTMNGSNGPPMQPAQQPPPYPPAQYPHPYQNGAPPIPSNLANGQPQQNGSQMLRFPLPPQTSMDARNMPGGRHKKEIKRRTKTGCLTCRKRRIKCDEAHPFCRNCAKSKRECMGYDPIFKQQPGPANIQPAPTGNPPSAPPPPQAIHPNAPTLPSYPSSYPGTGGTFVSSEQQQYGEYNGSSLDPALAGGDHMNMAQNNYHPSLQPLRKVKYVSMDDLFSLNDVPPQYNLREAPPPVSPATEQEIESFYKYHYSAGLDRLFETTWYTTRGLAALRRDPLLQDFVAQCAEQMRAKNGDEQTSRLIRSLEARLVWVLAAMPRQVAQSANGAGSDPQVQELLPRIDTVENLLTGQFLEPQRIPSSPQQPPSAQPRQESANQKYNEVSFWHNLGRFVSLRDDQSGALKDVNDCLQSMRGILNMLENRDVFYSITIARHIGGRMEGFHPSRHLVASTNDPNDELNKLKVAQQFVESEDQRGTTQVIQRVCSMAIRGWSLQKQ